MEEGCSQKRSDFTPKKEDDRSRSTKKQKIHQVVPKCAEEVVSDVSSSHEDDDENDDVVFIREVPSAVEATRRQLSLTDIAKTETENTAEVNSFSQRLLIVFGAGQHGWLSRVLKS